MGFFDKVGSMAQSAVDKSKELAEITKLNVSISNAEEQIKACKTAVGDYVVSNQLLSEDAAVREQKDAIDGLLAGIERDKETILKIKGVNICPGCSEEVAGGTKFCPKCGTSMPSLEQIKEEQAAETALLCPDCGSEVKDGMVFCGNCGAKIEKQ